MARKIQLEIVGDSRSIEKAFGRASKSAKGFHLSLKKSMTGLGKAARAGGAVIGGAAVTIGVLSVKAASDLGEQINKTGVVFGKGAALIQAWAKTTADSIGISNIKALEFSGTFGNMLVPMGIARTKAAGMSKALVNLAGDMASFNNANPEDVLEALRAGLAGETEPLRRFGVFLNQSRIEAEAMAAGIAKPTKDLGKIKLKTLAVSKAQQAYTKELKKHGPKSREAQDALLRLEYSQEQLTKALAGSKPKLTAMQKALATYLIIMKDTKDAQGDYQRTLNTSLPNAIRVLRAKLSDLSAAFGKGLLPVVTLATQKLRKVLADPEMMARVERLGYLVGTFLLNSFIKVGTWVSTHWPQIKQGFFTANAIIRRTAQGVDLIRTAFIKLKPFMAGVAKVFLVQFQLVLKIISGVLEALTHLPFGVGGKFKGALESVNASREAIAAASNAASAAMHGGKNKGGQPGEATGVRGNGGTRDYGTGDVYLDGQKVGRHVVRTAKRRANSTPPSRRGRHGGSTNVALS